MSVDYYSWFKNLQRLGLPSAGITDRSHHAQQSFAFKVSGSSLVNKVSYTTVFSCLHLKKYEIQDIKSFHFIVFL